MTTRSAELVATVTVVVPVFESARFLEEALRSIVTQATGPSVTVSVVVVDDGSTDAPLQVLGSFGPMVQGMRQAHAGAASARNRGVLATASEYLAFLDADDLWCAGKLTRQLMFLQSQPDHDMVFGHAEEFFDSEVPAEERQALVCRTGAIPAEVPGTMVIRRRAFLRAGLFDTSLQVGEFIGWSLAARDAGLRHHVLPDVVLRRRLHRTNTGRRLASSRGDYLTIARRALAARRREVHGR